MPLLGHRAKVKCVGSGGHGCLYVEAGMFVYPMISMMSQEEAGKCSA